MNSYIPNVYFEISFRNAYIITYTETECSTYPKLAANVLDFDGFVEINFSTSDIFPVREASRSSWSFPIAVLSYKWLNPKRDK